MPEQVGTLIKAAYLAVKEDRPAEALELTAAAAVCDIQQHAIRFLARASESILLAQLYEQACALVEDLVPGPPVRLGPGGFRRPVRVVYFAPSLVPGQAAAERLVSMVEHQDRDVIDAHVIVCEEFTRRTPPLRRLEFPDSPSAAIGAGLLGRLARAAVPTTILATGGDFIDAAREGICVARALRPDAAVFIASPACPVQAATAFARVAPVQVNQNIGVPLLVRGVDACIYRNPSAATSDQAALLQRGIKQVCIPAGGIDLDAIEAAKRIDRRTLGIPGSAVVFTSVSNRLPERLDPANPVGFGRALAEFLRVHRHAHWIGIGGGDFTVTRRLFASLQVERQVTLLGARHDVAAVLKAADVHLNEYPEGGSNSVLEAMACGLPVVALRSGLAHTHTIGAAIVGDSAASDSVEAYWRRAAELGADPSQRRTAGKANASYAKRHFGMGPLCGAYAEMLVKLVQAHF